MRLPRALLGYRATVEPYTGSGAHGDTFGVPVEIRCFVEWARRLVRDDDGNEIQTSGTVYAPLDVHAPAGSRVTIDGHTTTVIVARPRDGRGLPVPSHLELSLD